jgi:uncharacterized RDD family membrane protein YckC
VLLDDRVTIATPEGVSLELVLAGVGSRFVARLLDTLIQVAIIIALALGIYFTSTPGIVRAVVRVLLFLVLFGYDVPFEVFNGGRTVGKYAAGIRVVGGLGEPIGFLASAIRNILRVVDFLPVLYVGGVVSMVATRRDQRLGDLAAGTIVVRDRFPGLASAPGSPATVPVEAVATWDVSAVDQIDLVTIHQFLDRRLSMPIPIRAYFAGELASRVAPKVAGAPYQTHPEYLLEGIVVAKQARA